MSGVVIRREVKRRAMTEHSLDKIDGRQTRIPNSSYVVSDGPPKLPPSMNLGDIYTPAVVANWVAEELVTALRRTRRPVILDPACGEGALLAAVSAACAGEAKLIGVDIDPRAVHLAKRVLGANATIIKADALRPFRSQPLSNAWQRLLPDQSIDAIIVNPPWGADLLHSASDLRNAGFSLATGQFDSFDLFMELSLKLVKSRGFMAFIIPDALFLPEHQVLRRLLVENTRIHLIARLGEGFFPSVYRATAVVICQKQVPASTHQVQCFRLPKVWRDKVFSGSDDLLSARRKLTHLAPQTRFINDPGTRFNIDVTERDVEPIRIIGARLSKWTDWLISGRGVELSKGGQIVRCPKCNCARPLPRTPKLLLCALCAHTFPLKDAKTDHIIEKYNRSRKGWKRLIAGEDVKRYAAKPSYIIRTGVSGINYKDASSFRERKLLVRKTGVGIKAAIDETGAYTNQVVFHYRENPDKQPPIFFLDYLLGVLCSRVMLAYHLKNFGENEWRSHPYITQRVIAEFPIPNIVDDIRKWKQARAIAEAVKERCNYGPSISALDLKIDCLVAGLYGLSEQDCGWVLNVLESAQALEPIRTLRIVGTRELRPIQV